MFAVEKSIDGHNVKLMYVETWDGLYTAAGLRIPQGKGPFPLVLFAYGNGGGGMPWIVEAFEKKAYTINRFVEAGYVSAWIRYRSEVELGYNIGGPLIRDVRQGGDLFNRSPLEYEDEISVVEQLKKLPEIDADKAGLVGMSHGGEMALKIISEYHGLKAVVASEPAAHEYLSLNPDKTAFINEETQLRNIEEMEMHEIDKVMKRIDLSIAKDRINKIRTPSFIMGRNTDHLQGIFMAVYELLKSSGKETQWKSYDHDLHGFVFPEKNNSGEYHVDDVQAEAIKDSINFMNLHLKN
ncbi:MAG: hypothetical protein MAG581_00968 [Deltaproteobacteria bacterium]|nr:hypothetical protein [Deltaproteobacteria bacterium]